MSMQITQEHDCKKLVSGYLSTGYSLPTQNTGVKGQVADLSGLM